MVFQDLSQRQFNQDNNFTNESLFFFFFFNGRGCFLRKLLSCCPFNLKFKEERRNYDFQAGRPTPMCPLGENLNKSK
jgi:hypothetical protein